MKESRTACESLSRGKGNGGQIAARRPIANRATCGLMARSPSRRETTRATGRNAVSGRLAE